MKKCSKCHLTKPFADFHRRAARNGYAPACRECKSVVARAYREKNLEIVRQRSLDWHNANRDRSIANTVAWQQVNRDTYLSKRRDARAQAPDSARAAWRAWRDANRDTVRALKMKRYASFKNAVPIWSDEAAIRAIYEKAKRVSEATGIRHDVDHIVPLQSPIVCGLHVPANLQPLPHLENSSKGNRWWPDMP